MRIPPSCRAAYVALSAAAGLGAQHAPEAPRYDRDVRPILADRCFRCHGPDQAARRADLRLDRAEDAAAVLVPGDPDASELWRRVTTHDPDDVMPPPDSGRRALDDDERERIRAWIAHGAVYEDHWSFVPPTAAPVPTVRADAWCRTDVDRFVLARLEREGIAPGPLADPATQVRRLFLTLTGLPPEPADTAAFAADPSDAAWDRLVDRLLDEEPWRSRTAENLAVPWLDAARYADTIGLHTDNGQQLWVWRDWVLRALRDNMPYDRFATEQLAGDLLPDASQDQRVATGFHRCQVITDEGGAIDEEYLVEYAVERTAVTGSVFLGLTLGCARCHEHKFDPISQDEFYGLYAYFDSIDQPGLYSQTRNPRRAFEPFVRVPGPDQAELHERLEAELAQTRAALETPSPAELAELAEFERTLRADTGLRWAEGTLVAAMSTGGAAMTVLEDGSARASGPNPDRDHHELRWRTDATDLRLLCVEALTDPAHFEGKVGRAENGNAVLQGVEVEAISVRDPVQRQRVALVWAWADIEQRNRDFGVCGALRSDDRLGWAVAAHEHPAGPRHALFLASAPFGYEGGTELVVTLHYDSIYPRHTFGRVRVSAAAFAENGCDRLPEATGGWYLAGPFPGDSSDAVWEQGDGPEAATAIDGRQRFALNSAAVDGAGGEQTLQWAFQEDFVGDKVHALPDGVNRSYVAQQVFAPTARTRELSLGSDDGFRLYVAGVEVAQNRVDRGAEPDQDRATIAVPRGPHLLTMKIVNTGGNAGFYLRRVQRDGELAGDLVGALLPVAARAAFDERVRAAFRLQYSPGYAALAETAKRLERELEELDGAIPRAMVMREREEPRPTYVLERGEYDKPLKDRPVRRGVPAALGALPDGAPDDRRGLAQWLVADQNPLFARVQVNRLWQLLFGAGLVRTSEDFGMQGEWPSHPELLDWLAVDFRTHGYDVRRMLRQLARSAVFRQSNRARPELAADDPDNRLLASYPRRRLSAEQLRDQALFASGLLVERFGGPPVKPYQPPGLWQEVAMTQSNTRTFERDSGDALFRRSLYTYYKRACPPPFLLQFDAPTREFCTVRRVTTNTPQQALALWNDEQLVEAARVLAQRALDDGADDAERLAAMHRRCTGRDPDAAGLRRLQEALSAFRGRFAAAPDDAAALLAVGTVPAAADTAPAELAALTLIASALLNLDATVCVP
ncbi:MAG: DUF1553 domain-containing protein [Planctomycetota bacterium]